jgi:uncharacterized protein YbcI
MSHSTEASQGIVDLLRSQLHAFYQTELGHQPEEISCQLSRTTLAIVVKNSVTQPERLLLDHGQHHLVRRIRSNLEKVMRPQIKEVIEQLTEVAVIDLLMDTHLHTNQTSIIALLSNAPSRRTTQTHVIKTDRKLANPIAARAAFSKDDDE